MSVDALESALKQSGTPVTRTDSGITISKIQVSAALDRLQGVNRRRFRARDNRHVLLLLRMSAFARGLIPPSAEGNSRKTFDGLAAEESRA